MVDEVKGKTTDAPYEKSRLVIQAFLDKDKKTILTQSPTVQRCSQRLLLALAPSLRGRGARLFLRDITQAYIQSTTMLARRILARPPKEIMKFLPVGTLMEVLRPLYGIAKAGLHWWNTYWKHLCEKLSMEPSTYDPCLLITNDPEAFGIMVVQTDDTLACGVDKFVAREESGLNEAELIAKPIERLTPMAPLLFNGTKVIEDENETSCYGAST